MNDYNTFLRSKVVTAPVSGFDVPEEAIHPALKPHQRDAVRWALHGGRRALFEKFGLGKSVQQLEWCRQVMMHEGGKALIVLPLGVRQEFVHDAVHILGMKPPKYITHQAQAEQEEDGTIFLTNYERVRDGDINPKSISKTFMTIPPTASGAVDVWDDITRIKTLNTTQNRRKQTMHVCPLQIDIVERIIRRYSNEGDLVFDPFGGIGTVPLTAIKMGRKGLMTELNPDYYRDAVDYLRAEEDDTMQNYSLFDMMGYEA